MERWGVFRYDNLIQKYVTAFEAYDAVCKLVLKNHSDPDFIYWDYSVRALELGHIHPIITHSKTSASSTFDKQSSPLSDSEESSSATAIKPVGSSRYA